MTLRSAHGKAKRYGGSPRVEVLPASELPEPVAVEAAPVRRRPNGTIADSETARLLGARGGRAKSQRAALTSALGLAELSEDAAFRSYYAAGDALVREHLARLTEICPDLSAGTSSIVCSAGVQLAASRFLSDRAATTGDPKLFAQASQLANDSRQNLLAAYELAVREAKAHARAATDAHLFEPEAKS